MRTFYYLGFIQGGATATEMTTGGWVFMIGAWASIISLAIFCFSKILRNKKKRGADERNDATGAGAGARDK